MAKKTVGYVELEWTCPRCRSRNPGPQKTCTGCGAPQPKNVEFQQAAEEKILTDKESIGKAKSGPDIHCAYCGARNPAGASICTQCGADLGQGTARQSGQVVGALRDKPAPEIDCPSCGAKNPATALKCSKCGAALKQTPKPTPAASPEPKKQGCGIWPFVAIGAVALLALIAFIVLSSRTTDTVGRVAGVSWNRNIVIEQLGPVSYEDWKDEIPAEAAIGTCTQRVHHTQDQPAPGAVEVCGTPYVVDQGSGYGEVTQDCQYEVSASWCEYTVQEWKEIEPIVASGVDYAPFWPDTNLTTQQRQGARHETYTIIFDTDGKEYTYTTTNQAEFGQCQIGSRWVLKINAFGNVVGIEPK